MTTAEMPKAWADLVEGLTLLARGRTDDVSPTHCEHDEMRVMADPARFTDDEVSRLSYLGFVADDEAFYSYRFGSA